jgi:hypothetical protein
LENASNIQGVTGPTIGQIAGNTVQVTYGFKGLDTAFGNCPGGGHATVVVTFVVQRQAIIASAASVMKDSVTVTLPDGLSLKSAILSIVETDNASAKFSASCNQAMLDTKVRGGQIAAQSRAELINQLQYRSVNAAPIIGLKATGPAGGGTYEINCQ